MHSKTFLHRGVLQTRPEGCNARSGKVHPCVRQHTEVGVHDGKARLEGLRVEERLRPRVLRSCQGAGVSRVKVERLILWAHHWKVLKIVEMTGLIQKGKIKMKLELSVLKAVGSGEL